MDHADARKLFGTTEPLPDIIRLEAGPVSLELHGGTVRYVRYAGHEAIRGIDYLVRDDSWRTPPAKLSPARQESTAEGFRVTLDGEVKQDDIHFRYRLTIEGDRGGRLEVAAEAEALSSFMTNRTGFVVLHPIIGVAGRLAIVTHKDGSSSVTTFPELISPGQPIFDIRSIRHAVTPELFVTCLMEAELPHDPETIFEMEDQRNWTDASYKTYVGSLLDPWPYRLEAGQTIKQRIVLSFETTTAIETAGSDTFYTVGIDDRLEGEMPTIGLGLMPSYRAELAAADHPARELGPRFLTLYAECDAPDLDAVLADYQKLVASFNAEVQLELVLPEGRSPAEVLADAASACERASLQPARVLVCPRAYLKSIQPVGPWPEVHDLAHIYSEARKAFPEAAILGGMLSYFTELNRKRPPTATVGGISCTTTPIVHAADDGSVMETLEAMPAVIQSMQAMAAGKSLHLGPSAIGMRHNPYGAATAANPEKHRIAMAENDPRQSGLFAAAWTVGYAAMVADSQAVTSLALNHLAGPSGVAGADGTLYPVFHVMMALCAAGGAARVPLDIEGDGLAGLAWRNEGITTLLLANLRTAPVTVAFDRAMQAKILDIDSVEPAARNPRWSISADADEAKSCKLGAYAVLFATA